MGVFIDLTGKTFGRLRVINREENGFYKKPHWNCICECKNYTVVNGNSLKRGLTTTCGCIYKNGNNKTHNLTKTVEYRTWASMKSRCLNNNDQKWKYYGARGITICEEWVNSFEVFLKDMGKRPSNKHSIDRINNNGNYEPNNCRWTTIDIQSKNKRNSKTLNNN